MAATKKRPVKKKRTMSAAQKAALARGRAKLKRAKTPVKKKVVRKKPLKKTTSKKVTAKTKTVTVYKKPSTKTGGSMAKKRKSVKRVASRTKRKAGAFLRKSDAMPMLKSAGLAIAGGVGAGMLANKVPIADKRIKSALPIVAGIVLSGTMGRKSKLVKGVAEGMVILGAVSLFKNLAPNVPFLAGDETYFIPQGIPYNPQQQIDDGSMGETVRVGGEVVDMGIDEYYSPADM